MSKAAAELRAGPFALFGTWLRGMDDNLITQIGFIVLISLAARNAVLIVCSLNTRTWKPACGMKSRPFSTAAFQRPRTSLRCPTPAWSCRKRFVEGLIAAECAVGNS